MIQPHTQSDRISPIPVDSVGSGVTDGRVPLPVRGGLDVPHAHHHVVVAVEAAAGAKVQADLGHREGLAKVDLKTLQYVHYHSYCL